MLPDTLKELELEFGERFLRVHRNALVALQHIVRLQRDEEGTWRAVLDGLDERPVVSRRHLAEVKQRLLLQLSTVAARPAFAGIIAGRVQGSRLCPAH